MDYDNMTRDEEMTVESLILQQRSISSKKISRFFMTDPDASAHAAAAAASASASAAVSSSSPSATVTSSSSSSTSSDTGQAQRSSQQQHPLPHQGYQWEREVPVYWGFRRGINPGDPCEIFPIFHRVTVQPVRPPDKEMAVKLKTADDVKQLLDEYRLEDAEVHMENRRRNVQRDHTALEKLAKKMGM
jgi:hypothetical protein